MNNRLLSRVKALNFTVDKFPEFTEENSERYIELRFKLSYALIKKGINKVIKKYPKRPKLKKKLLDMFDIYDELIYAEMSYICENTEALPTASDITSKHDELLSVIYNSGPLINPMSKNAQEFLDYINKFKE